LSENLEENNSGRKDRTIQEPVRMISLRPSSKGARRVLFEPRPFRSVPSPGPPRGLFQKTGLIPGHFPAKIPWDDRAPAESPSAGALSSRRTRNFPERRRRSRGQRALSVPIILKHSLGVLEILEFWDSPSKAGETPDSGDLNDPPGGVLAQSTGADWKRASCSMRAFLPPKLSPPCERGVRGRGGRESHRAKALSHVGTTPPNPPVARGGERDQPRPPVPDWAPRKHQPSL
jgi:hypothetical protein